MDFYAYQRLVGKIEDVSSCGKSLKKKATRLSSRALALRVARLGILTTKSQCCRLEEMDLK
jgi:hypothetical protein